MNYVYYGYLAVALVIAYLVVKGKGNKAFTVAYLTSLTVFPIYGFIYIRWSYLGINDSEPAYHALAAITLFILLQWAKNSFKIKLFDRRWR